MEAFLDYKGSRIFYRKHGKGDHLLLAFHGYGRDSSSFDPILPTLNKKYTTIAIDLPYHGHTQWKLGSVFDRKDLAQVAGIFIRQEGKKNYR